ncbi:uncharacterized protein C14orf119 homolog [Carcharodon carcharias]|uniref:uncharacterized protein C14orf119 homolog n=1 Tax=Carcharodon carcharias TaxID=13397 RepID=UPI001B7DD4F3|nr:uncharacterized protein C14orf119 homolog [Carcharodon carcharias]XP_041036889.1 uncharacterized protein C14orf119 homolog [Carcharodon carcharias]
MCETGGSGPLPPPSSYVTSQEVRCVLHWFTGWSPAQREVFLGQLVRRAVPGKVWTLLDALGGLGLSERPPSLFQCQLRLWDRWFEGWTEMERNVLVARLEDLAPDFTARFYREVAATAGTD